MDNGIGSGQLGADVWAPTVGRRRLGAVVWAPGSVGRRRLGAEVSWAPSFGRGGRLGAELFLNKF